MNIEIVNGHILFDDGNGMILLDTGSPFSFHKSGSMTVGNDKISLPTSLLCISAEYITDKVGIPVKGLLGMDYISKYKLLIDVPNKILSFDADPRDYEAIESSVSSLYANINATIGNKQVIMIVDTGAPVSYISPSFIGECPKVGKAKDFSPFIEGEFETDIYEVPVVINNHSFKMNFGVLPQSLQLQLNMVGADAAIGMELLEKTSVILSDGRVFIPGTENQISLKRI